MTAGPLGPEAEQRKPGREAGLSFQRDGTTRTGTFALRITPADTLQVPWGAYSLRWFSAVFDHADLVTSFWNSLLQ